MAISPTINTNPDWSAVIALIQDYIDDLNNPDITSDELSDYPEQVFEAALEAMYGAGIWDQINPILYEL